LRFVGLKVHFQPAFDFMHMICIVSSSGPRGKCPGGRRDEKRKIKGGGTVAAQEPVCTRVFAARETFLLVATFGKPMTRHRN
jgi:hypothetical protein